MFNDFNGFMDTAAKHRVVPVSKELFFSGESPLTIFEKLGVGRKDSFLLESADQGVWSRYSFVGVSSRGRIVQEMDSDVRWIPSEGKTALPKDLDIELPANALDAIESIQKSWFSQYSALGLPLTSGLVGMIGWDVVRDLESLPEPSSPLMDTPRISFAMIRDLIVIDHQTSTLTFISNVYVEGQSGADLEADFKTACSAIESMISALANSVEPYLAEVDFAVDAEASANFRHQDFLNVVDRAKEFIRIGDVFQVVISQAFEAVTDSTALELYRVLRVLNPSPYMYLINGSDSVGDFSIIGSSPEALVTVQNGNVVTHPIAGSRPRGLTVEEDIANEASLLGDAKERAEHLMLVDLARNDLLRVCDPSSVAVSEFMAVHKYSHIMHLVSTVVGRLDEGRSSVDVFKSTFPAGTLSGAPKPRALEIIQSLEPTHRGLYGGVCGYFDFAGNSDLAIAIRTAFKRGNRVVVQAGAGLVLDSVPETEYQETKSKARAVLRAVSAANSAHEVH